MTSPLRDTANGQAAARDSNIDGTTTSERSPIELFMTGLIIGTSTKSSRSISSAPLPFVSVEIVQDRARGLERSFSRSFRKARHKMGHARRRRRTRALDPDAMSRWDSSYPHPLVEKAKVQAPAARCNSPPRCPLVEARRDAVHRALVAAHSAVQEVQPSSSDEESQALSQTRQVFTPCSTWLSVVAKNACFSPKPNPRQLQLQDHGTENRHKQRNSTKHHSARHCATPRKNLDHMLLPIRKRSPKSSVSSVAECTNVSVSGVSLDEQRVAALSGAPRRPHRQASLNDIEKKHQTARIPHTNPTSFESKTGSTHGYVGRRVPTSKRASKCGCHGGQ